MLKALVYGDGTAPTVVLLGLEPGNLERMREKKPVHVDLRELGLPYPVQIVIFTGESVDAMVAELRAAGITVPEPEKPGRN